MLSISVIASMALAVNVDKQPMLPIIVKAIDQLFHEPKDMFWTGRVMDVLFDGIPIDCSSDDFAASAACSVFKSGDVKAVRQIDDDHFKFSLFAGVSFRFGEKKLNRTSFSRIQFRRQTEPIWVNSRCFAGPSIQRTLDAWSPSMTKKKWTIGTVMNAIITLELIRPFFRRT